jgi:uncharacterized protein (DUF1697 family)
VKRDQKVITFHASRQATRNPEDPENLSGLCALCDKKVDMMNTIIALLRGINVGGHNKLPMRELKVLLEGMGLANVQTYIQSGNVVFQSEETEQAGLAQRITAVIEASYGFAPQVFLLDLASLQAAMAANPFPEGEAEPSHCISFFWMACRKIPI